MAGKKEQYDSKYDIYIEAESLEIQGDLPGFVTRENKIITFRESNEALKKFTNTEFSEYDISNFLEDEDKRNWIKDLFNSCLRNHLEEEGLDFDSDRRRFFFTTEGDELKASWPPSPRSRSVVKHMSTGDYAHQAVKAEIIELDTFYLRLNSCWYFTKNGQYKVSEKDQNKYSSQYSGGPESRNNAIVNNVRFWLTVASNSKGKVDLEDNLVFEGCSLSDEVNIRRESDYIGFERIKAEEKYELESFPVEDDENQDNETEVNWGQWEREPSM